MRNSKIYNLILYVIIINLIIFIIISNKSSIIDNKKIILKNMDETTEVSNLNNEINNLNLSYTQYSNYIQTSKINLATAITNAGIETDTNADFETMIANVSNIITSKTGDATATASGLLSGQTAYVNGEKITGTMINREALNWAPSTSTSYTVPAGYYSGGTLNSEGAYNAGYAAGQSSAVDVMTCAGLVQAGTKGSISKSFRLKAGTYTIKYIYTYYGNYRVSYVLKNGSTTLKSFTSPGGEGAGVVATDSLTLSTDTTLTLTLTTSNSNTSMNCISVCIYR